MRTGVRSGCGRRGGTSDERAWLGDCKAGRMPQSPARVALPLLCALACGTVEPSGQSTASTDDASSGASSIDATQDAASNTLPSGSSGSTQGVDETGSGTDTDDSTASTDDDSDTTTVGVEACDAPGELPYVVEFSTYLGGASDWEHTRDVFIDATGSIYVAGGTRSADFPVTAGAYDTSFGGGGGQVGSDGYSDAFVAKFSPDGQLEWATFLGGPNYDRAYAIEVDADGFVYVAGRSGPGFPTTAGVFQPEYLGHDAGIYGIQNGFVAKLGPDGDELVWSSQLGVAHLVRDFDLDDAGNIYAVLAHQAGSAAQPDPAWLAAAMAGAAQPSITDAEESGLVKIDTDGAQVEWATWLGGSGMDSSIGSVAVDAQQRPHLAFYTASTDLPTTATDGGASHHGGTDVYVARLATDGSAVEMGAYVGGGGDDGFETHGVALSADAVFVAGFTSSADLATTAGAFQPALAGGDDAFVVRLDDGGDMVAATYVGGSAGEGVDGLAVTSSGEVSFVGETNSDDLPVTPGAFQDTRAGDFDAFVIRLAPDLDVLRYGTYIGGPAHDNGRGAFVGENCEVVMAGASAGAGFPTVNAWQPSFAGGSGQYGNGDNILTKFTLAR